MAQPLFPPDQRDAAGALAAITYCNPFTPERAVLERRLLGSDHDEGETERNLRRVSYEVRANVARMLERAEVVVAAARANLAGAETIAGDDLHLYTDLVLFLLYHRYAAQLSEHMRRVASAGDQPVSATFYEAFAADYAHLLTDAPRRLPEVPEPPHLFANFYQIRRAFHHIHQHITGLAASVSRLRAEVWQSIFTHDMRRYRRVLYRHMGEYTTLITGPSGTGKELVARAIGLSRYSAFDPRRGTFAADTEQSFYAVNLSALPVTLIESALFGHKKGSFTGASDHHRGYLSVCPAEGTVFLDEIGDVAAEIQLKLLRLLQTRTFQALGDTHTQEFQGKLIAATNRDLGRAMQEGALRQDFYYRLCADTIATPCLAVRLAEHPQELDLLLEFIAVRLVGAEEAPALAREVGDWIRTHLGTSYPWPGNVRELEQCAQNVMIRNAYSPLPVSEPVAGADSFLDLVRSKALGADDLLAGYCTYVYAECKSYTEVARRLGLDRRTVKAKINPGMLEEME